MAQVAAHLAEQAGPLVAELVVPFEVEQAVVSSEAERVAVPLAERVVVYQLVFGLQEYRTHHIGSCLHAHNDHSLNKLPYLYRFVINNHFSLTNAEHRVAHVFGKRLKRIAQSVERSLHIFQFGAWLEVTRHFYGLLQPWRHL